MHNASEADAAKIMNYANRIQRRLGSGHIEDPRDVTAFAEAMSRLTAEDTHVREYCQLAVKVAADMDSLRQKESWLNKFGKMPDQLADYQSTEAELKRKQQQLLAAYEALRTKFGSPSAPS